jgi:hypothetical protein
MAAPLSDSNNPDTFSLSGVGRFPCSRQAAGRGRQPRISVRIWRPHSPEQPSPPEIVEYRSAARAVPPRPAGAVGGSLRLDHLGLVSPPARSSIVSNKPYGVG